MQISAVLPISTRLLPHHPQHRLPCLCCALQPSLWGGKSDGPGCSIVFCFRLRPDFDPDTFANQKALQLFERFLTGGSEADGMPTRDR